MSYYSHIWHRIDKARSCPSPPTACLMQGESSRSPASDSTPLLGSDPDFHLQAACLCPKCMKAFQKVCGKMELDSNVRFPQTFAPPRHTVLQPENASQAYWRGKMVLTPSSHLLLEGSDMPLILWVNGQLNTSCASQWNILVWTGCEVNRHANTWHMGERKIILSFLLLSFT